MKLAISNIAWNPENNSEAFALLKRHRISRLEIAPTKIWPSPEHVSQQQALAYKQSMQQIGINLVAMQSLLFNRPELHLFSTESVRNELRTYLFRITDLCSWLEIPVMVFGSPKNRLRGNLSEVEVQNIAIPFFREIGNHAAKKNVCFCIEANASAYGCDFITETDEAYKLVQDVASDGFGLHLDLGNMIMSNEDWAAQIKKYFNIAKHFHLSAPKLESVASLAELSQILALLNSFPNVVSVEMRPSENCISEIENVLDQIKQN